MNLQQTFNHHNVTRLLIFIENLFQMSIRNLVTNDEIQVSNWKILTKFLNLRFHGFNNVSQFKFFIDQAISTIQNCQKLDLVRHCFKFLSEFIQSDLLLSIELTDDSRKNKFSPIEKKLEDLGQKL